MMDDLISRQAAIDAFDCTDELIVSGSANAQNVVNYINKVVGKIKALPSAQPCIIRCKDCRYWWNKHLCKAHSIYGTYDTKESDFCSRAEKREDE